MSNCRTIDPLVTSYVDNELPDGDRELVDQHMRVCPPCEMRIHAERAIHDLIQARRKTLGAAPAPAGLRARCALHAWRQTSGASTEAASMRPGAAEGGEGASAERVMVSMAPGPTALRPSERPARPSRLSSRLAPLALAASLVLVVGAAFVYQLTAYSSRVMATELAADHVKCFAMNDVLGTHQAPATVESSMWLGFGWRMRVPSSGSGTDFELIGSRVCLYGDGRVAHIMYRHHGEPLSLYMVPRTSRAREEMVQVLGHRAAVWCDGERTFVLVGRQPKEEVERMALAVQTSMR